MIVKRLNILVLFFLLKGFNTTRRNIQFEITQNFTERVQSYGYLSEEHFIVTEDGYILTIFRLRHGKCMKKMRTPPVILLHGLLMSSDCWLDAGPNDGLAYLLADACFDLWVGNDRGNYYSRNHVELNPDTDQEYWQWSSDEIGKYDQPAVIDYVLKSTGTTELNVVGYSQGAGTLFVTLSERPDYCKKVKLHIALAPSTRLIHSKSVITWMCLAAFEFYQKLLQFLGINEIFAKGSLVVSGIQFLFKSLTLIGQLFHTGIALVDGFNEWTLTPDTKEIMFSHFPAGTSLMNLVKFSQDSRNEVFMKFDYGKENNMLVYGLQRPPIYNFTAVDTSVVLIYSVNDIFVDIKDLFWLAESLPNVIGVERVLDTNWDHLHTAFSRNVKKYLFPNIMKYLHAFRM